VASVGTLDLLGEARAARALGGFSSEQALALATRDGARALGMDGEVGALRPGLWGDAAVLAIPACGAPETVLEAVLAGAPADVQETTLGGRTVYRQ
jgi:5-methylthioadenosine/S-adenosylhomocysteine deaminase